MCGAQYIEASPPEIRHVGCRLRSMPFTSLSATCSEVSSPPDRLKPSVSRPRRPYFDQQCSHVQLHPAKSAVQVPFGNTVS
jgi:hypothetical protein